MLKNPIRYSPDVETIGPDEQETIDGLNKTFSYNVEKTHEDLGHPSAPEAACADARPQDADPHARYRGSDTGA